MCFLTAEFPQRCLLTRKFHSFRGPRLQSQGSGFGAWESWGTGGKLSISIRKLLRGGGLLLVIFCGLVFLFLGVFFFFFRSYVYYRMQIRIRYLQIILKAHIVLLKDTSILAYHFMKSFISQTNHCFISC